MPRRAMYSRAILISATGGAFVTGVVLTALYDRRPQPPPGSRPEHEALLKFGLPGDTNLFFHKGHVVSYDRRMKQAHWAYEHVNAATLRNENGSTREKSTFSEVETLPEHHRAKLSDYRGSGFDRGHLVPAADMRGSQEAMNDTFFLDNISPQVGNGFNRHYWARLERLVRKLGYENNVWACSGPLFLPHERNGKWYVNYRVLGDPPNVPVPTHFFKVILVEAPDGSLMLASFILPNAPIAEDTPIENFLVSLEKVEKEAGLTFFPKIKRDTPAPLCVGDRCLLPPSWTPSEAKTPHQLALPPPAKEPLRIESSTPSADAISDASSSSVSSSSISSEASSSTIESSPTSSLEASPTESEAAPTDSEASPTESETSPTESEASSTESESSPVKSDATATPSPESSPTKESSDELVCPAAPTAEGQVDVTQVDVHVEPSSAASSGPPAAASQQPQTSESSDDDSSTCTPPAADLPVTAHNDTSSSDALHPSAVTLQHEESVAVASSTLHPSARQHEESVAVATSTTSDLVERAAAIVSESDDDADAPSTPPPPASE